MEHDDHPAETLAENAQVRQRAAGLALPPLWHSAAFALLLAGWFLLGRTVDVPDGWGIHLFAAWVLCLILLDLSRGQLTGVSTGAAPVRGRYLWLSMVTLIAFMASAIWLDATEAPRWASIACAITGGVTLFALTAVGGRRAVPPDVPRGGFVLLDPVLGAPGRLPTMAAVCAVDGRVDAEFLGRVDPAPTPEMRGALLSLGEAGYLTFPQPWLRGPRRRVWIRATSRGRSAYYGHITALRELASESGAA
ncbi:hypothetical protein [Demequina silvatica]|uniref:hypothetical protein n=1 Tax=Demequina silvatica TaxID=1638988 RepID=UPI000784E597|nr:hypothetical protein [Demequina silvatica]